MKRKNRRWYLLILGIMICMAFAGCGSKVDGLFEDLEWGTVYTDVEAAITAGEAGAMESTEDHSMIRKVSENYLGVEGVTGRTEYVFAEDKLQEVFVYLEFDENSFSNEEIMERYTEILMESYGKPSKETGEAKEWKLGKSEVQLANFSYGVLVLDYKAK